MRNRKSHCKHGHDTSSPDSRVIGGMCKICKLEYMKKYNASPDRKTKERQRGINRKRSGNWTAELFDKVLLEQGNVCAIGRHAFTEDNPPCADHKHEDNSPRGILCFKHNAALGLFNDCPEELEEAAAYLRTF